MNLSVAEIIKAIIPFVVSLIFVVFHWIYYRQLPVLSTEEEESLTENELLSKYPKGFHYNDGATHSTGLFRFIELIIIVYHFPLVVIGSFIFPKDTCPGWFYQTLTPILYSSIILFWAA